MLNLLKTNLNNIMAILDALKNKKNEEPEEKKVSKSVKKTKEVVEESNSDKIQQKNKVLQNVLKHPRITEKAAILAEKNAYTFEIDPQANKIDVARAIKKVYNVEPVRVNIIKLPAKRVIVRGRRGVKSAIKKAIVYLKEGDKIEFV